MSQAADSMQRHRFVIVVPVADRPQQLTACLDSLQELCRIHGGNAADKQRVSVLIADDSLQADNILRHKNLAARCNAMGLPTEYFGLDQQQALLAAIPDTRRAALTGVLGVGCVAHKGASLMRNIVYLRLAQLADARSLFWFIDSDQTFQVRVLTPEGERDVYALDYFHEFDRVFSHTDAMVVTGKVVGDPPVSPSVMAANFLADVEVFLETLSRLDLQAPCQFHAPAVSASDAAYHDMASLFGFSAQSQTFSYPCPLHGTHSNADALVHFAVQLNGFFHGEHPTRKNYYQFEDTLASVKPARTVYTGNYCLRPQALRYFIPYASLKLRMAGPVLGRLLKQQLGAQFVTANLPMLHARTLNADKQFEFRPGVDRDEERIELAGEQERQFYGDVMLFTVEKLTAMAYPAQTPDAARIAELFDQTLHEITAQYAAKRQETCQRIRDVQTKIAHLPGQTGTQFQHFIANMERNFGAGSTGYAAIERNVSKRRQEILQAIAGYQNNQRVWNELMHARLAVNTIHNR